MTENLIRLLPGIEKMLANPYELGLGASAVQDMANQQNSILQGIGSLADMSQSTLRVYQDLQMPTLSLLASSFRTPMIEALKGAVANMNYMSCILIVEQALSTTHIQVADMAFLKNSRLAEDIREELAFPRGFRTALDRLNRASA